MARKTKPTNAPKVAPTRRLGRKPVPENETRHDRFLRIGTKRMNNVIRQIQLLGNLCSPNYDCEPNDLALMRDAITRELDMAFARFTPRKRQAAANGFTFAQGTSHSANILG